jgi:hypothetical protein
MVERGISDDDVQSVLLNGEEIESYPDDFPYPSRLLLAWCESRPIHLLVADNVSDNESIIITVYQADTMRWEVDFRRRRIK